MIKGKISTMMYCCYCEKEVGIPHCCDNTVHRIVGTHFVSKHKESNTKGSTEQRHDDGRKSFPFKVD